MQKNTLLILIPLSFAFIIFLTGTMAADFSATEVASQLHIAKTKRTITFNITNTNSTINITNVSLTFSNDMAFISASNATTASGTSFNWSTPGLNWTLSWSNTSAAAVIANGSSQNFTFQAFLPTAQSFPITLILIDNESVVNRTTLIINVSGTAVSSGNFSSHQSSVVFNWTPVNVTLEANINNTPLYFDNGDIGNYGTTTITPAFFSPAAYPTNIYPSLGTDNQNLCIPTGGGMSFSVGSEYSPSNTTPALNETQTAIFELSILSFCPPGKYTGSLFVNNLTDSSKNLSITATVKVPISVNNTFNSTNKMAFFKGTVTTGGSHNYSFYTNLSTAADFNFSGVSINLSGLSNDADLFLLNSSNSLLAKSIRTGSSTESIGFVRFNYVSPDLWEIRVANATTSYTGDLYFTTLNSTDSVDTSQEVTRLSYGQVTVGQTVSENFTLLNEGDFIVPNVLETSEIYQTTTFTGSSPSSFELLIPYFASKLKVSIVWDNSSTDWDLQVRNTNDTHIANSTDKSIGAIESGVVLEEFVELGSNYFSTTTQGLWNITVLNQTNLTFDNYNITATIWFTASDWISSSYQTFNFNATGGENFSRNVTINITPPTNASLNGSYQGFIRYSNNTGWGYEIPLDFSVKAPLLVVNNTLGYSTVNIKENIGFNKVISLNITYNNTGDDDLSFTYNAPATLNLTTTKVIILTSSLPGTVIQAGESGTINLSLTINTTKTSDTSGIYSGLISISTNNTVHTSFNLTIRVNLTNALNVTVLAIDPTLVGNQSRDNELTYDVQVRLMNGTIISIPTRMTIGNFTSASIRETNISSTITLVNRTLPGDSGGCSAGTELCRVNWTIPPQTIGGGYNATINVQWKTNNFSSGSGATLSGAGRIGIVSINNSGYNITSNSGLNLGDFDEFTSIYFNATVKNFGPLQPTDVSIIFNEGSCDITVLTQDGSGGGCIISEPGGATFTATIPASNSVGCWFRWKLTGTNVTEDETCSDASVTIGNKPTFFNISSIRMRVEDTSSNGGNGGGTGGGTGGAVCTKDSECSASAACVSSKCKTLDCKLSQYRSDHKCVDYAVKIVDFESNISMLWGGSNFTQVKVDEAKNSSIKVKLDVTVAGKVDVTVKPDTCAVPCTFNVTLKSDNDTEIGKHKGTFKASYTISDKVSESKDFTVSVIPTEEKKKEIKKNYEDMLPTLDSLKREFEALKASGKLSGDNLTLIQSLIDTMSDISSKIKSSIDGNDYMEASSLLFTLNSTISKIKSKFSEAGGGGVIGFSFDFTWIIVGAVVVVVGAFLVYLMLPPSETSYKKFKPASKPGIMGVLDKIKGGVKNIFKKKEKTRLLEFSTHPKGYEKKNDFEYKKKGSLRSLLKWKKKKKQKRLGEY